MSIRKQVILQTEVKSKFIFFHGLQGIIITGFCERNDNYDERKEEGYGESELINLSKEIKEKKETIRKVKVTQEATKNTKPT